MDTQIKYDVLEIKLEMWTNAQRDSRPAEYRWRPLFNATKFGWTNIGHETKFATVT